MPVIVQVESVQPDSGRFGMDGCLGEFLLPEPRLQDDKWQSLGVYRESQTVPLFLATVKKGCPGEVCK